MPEPREYFYNTATHQVEEGRQSSWGDRMGPYPTREEAEQALQRAAARTTAWDEQDRREREEREAWETGDDWRLDDTGSSGGTGPSEGAARD